MKGDFIIAVCASVCVAIFFYFIHADQQYRINNVCEKTGTYKTDEWTLTCIKNKGE